MASWKDVAGEIADAAPLLGGILGGPIGAGIGVVGKLLSSALGTKESPDDVLNALKTNPDALVKVKQLELDHQLDLQKLAVQAAAQQMAQETAQLQEETKQVSAVNATMQAEAKSEHWPEYSWRPAVGFAVALGVLSISLAFAWILYRTLQVLNPVQALSELPGIISAMSVFWGGVFSLLGITAYHRGRLLRAQVGDVPTGSVLDRVLPKRTSKLPPAPVTNPQT